MSSTFSYQVESLEQRRLLSASLPAFHVFGVTLLVPDFHGGPNSPVTRQGPVNGDFSQFPDLTGWATEGNTGVQASDYHTIPDGKTSQAVLSTAQEPNNGVLPDTAAHIESFLGLSAGSLSTAGKPSTNGSAMKQTVTGKKGDIVSFKADFLTNELAKGGNGDYAFITLSLNGNTEIYKITGALTATNPLDSSGLTSETGYQTYDIILPKNGQYTLGYGVVNVTNTIVSSALAVSNVQLQPEFHDFDDFLHGFGGGHDQDGKDGKDGSDQDSFFGNN